MFDRRREKRRPLDVYFNKYVDGYPHLCRAVDVSQGGMLASNLFEPAHTPSAFPVEVQLPDEPAGLWIWARRVGRRDGKEAVRFVSMSEEDSARLAAYLA